MRKRDNNSTNNTTKMRTSGNNLDYNSCKKASRNSNVHRALSVNRSIGTTVGYFNIRNNSINNTSETYKSKKST